MLPPPEVTIPMLKPHTQTAQDADDYDTGSEFESLLDTMTPQLAAQDTDDYNYGSEIEARDMTPQLARQKAAELSYEIGALLKIKERLERQRERLLITYCYTTQNLNS